MRSAKVPSPGRLRRAASIVCYWRDSKLIFENYLTRVLISADPIVAWLLDCFSEWQTPAQACSRASEFTPSSVESALRQLTRRGFLVREGSVAARADAKLQESWSSWLPAAGLLHFSTKDLPYVSDLGESRRMFLDHARREPAPPAVKQYPRAARVQLPNPNTKGEFPQVLLARRTWREFSERRVDLEDLSTLLWLTCGVQYWVKLPGSIGRVALKTSPSAGARHPLEVYVAALRYSLQSQSAGPVLLGGHPPHGAKPNWQCSPRVLEDRSGGDRSLASTLATLPQTSHRPCPLRSTAWAAKTRRPPELCQIRPTRLLGSEVRL